MKTLCAFLLLSVAAVSQLSASSIYEFTVDTSSLANTSANLDFLLQYANTSSPLVNAAITGFNTDGSYDSGAILLNDGASGSLPGSLTLSNTGIFNDAFQSIVLGDYLNFFVTLSGPGVDTPDANGTKFLFSIYGEDGFTPLLSTSVDGSIAGVEIDSSVGIAPYTNLTDGGTSVASVAAAPEPSSIFLIGAAGIAALVAARRRRAA